MICANLTDENCNNGSHLRKEKKLQILIRGLTCAYVLHFGKLPGSNQQRYEAESAGL